MRVSVISEFALHAAPLAQSLPSMRQRCTHLRMPMEPTHESLAPQRSSSQSSPVLAAPLSTQLVRPSPPTTAQVSLDAQVVPRSVHARAFTQTGTAVNEDVAPRGCAKSQNELPSH